MHRWIRPLVFGTVLGVGAETRGVAAEYAGATAPQGVVAAQLALGLHGAAFPLIEAAPLVGQIVEHSGVQVTLGSVAAEAKAQLEAGRRYYVEILSGPWEGERFDLDSGATQALPGAGEVALDLGPQSFSTLRSLPDGALNGAQAAVRSHVRLRDLPAMFSPGLRGHNNAALADAVRLYGPGGFRTYYLRGDGVTWREPGRTVDESSRVLPPDESILVQLVSGPQRWLHAGLVRTNAFRKNLAAGIQTFATGYPVNLSPAAVGAFVDPAADVSDRWTGNNNAAAADRWQLLNAARTGFDDYQLRGDGVTWMAVTGGPDVSSTPLLSGTGLTVLRRVKPDNGYLIAPPF
ncbi:MAG TPA: hypothetical protein VHF69_11085 [Candidatus Synoicihabitans sp.]|nr:hypothetical protein [Candidatus Synoicihabitans sp.]